MKKLLMALVLLPLMATAENFRFEYIDNDDGTVMLTGVSGTVPSMLKVPAQIEGRNVSAVGYGFMSKNQKVSSIVISEGVCRIGEKAFCDCHSLESIEIPKSVIEIGDKAFASSRAAVSGQTTGGVSSLVVSPDNEFFEVVSGVLIDRKEGRAIVACANVRSVSLPDGVTTICDMAFCGCTELKTIQFPVSLMTIEGDKNFGACFSLENVDFHETSLVEVGEQAFALCKNLKTACFPSTLERIGSYAFNWCNALTSVQFVGREPIVVQVDKSDPMFPFGDIYVTSDSLDMSSNGAGPFTKHLDRVITYVLPDMGWENAVAKGEWQGRPIRYIGMSPQVGSLEVIPGEAVSFDTGLVGYTAKGLPSGLKYDKKTGKITGAAKKPTAAEGVTVKFTKKNEPDAERTIVVGPMPKLSIALEGDTEKCKVKGAGDYLVGKKVSLSATAPKGTAFAGWFADGAPWPNAEESKNAKLSYVMTKADVSLVAKFEKEQMSVGCAGLEGKSFTVGVAGGAGIPLEIETQSGVKSVKVSKLPAGMKYNAKTGLIEGAPTKAGDYTVQIAVTAKSGAVETKDIAIRVDPLPDWAVGTFSGMIGRQLESSGGNGTAFYGSLQFTVKATGAVSAKVTAGGKTYSFSAKGFGGVEDGEAFLSRVNYLDADEVACRVSDTLVLDLATRKGDSLLLGVTLFQKSGHLCVAKTGGTFVRSGCATPYGLIAWRNETGKDSRIAPGTPAAEAVARMKSLGTVYLKARELEPSAGGARRFALDWRGGEPLHRYGSKEADVTLSVDKSGNVKLSGKIDGVKLTASTPLRIGGNEWFTVTADSIAYDKKSGMDYEFMLGWDTVNPHTGVVSVTPDPNADPLTPGPDMHEFELWIEPFE